MGKAERLEGYDFLYDGIDLQAEIGVNASRLIIPVVFLHGRQGKNEYSERKRRQVEEALRRDGIRFLLEHPVIVCAVPRDLQLQLAIIDGHHRKRYAPLYGIYDIPSLVCKVSTMTRIINSHKPPLERIASIVFKGLLIEEMLIAQASFSSPLGDLPPAQLLPSPNTKELMKRGKLRSF